MLSYRDPRKNSVRRKIFGEVTRLLGRRPKDVVTLASHEGLCVKEMLRRWSGVNITNIERDSATLAEYQKLGLKTTDVCSEFTDYYNRSRGADFCFLDTMGFYSKSSADLYRRINARADFGVLAITLQDVPGIRGTGKLAERLRRAAVGVTDFTKSCIRKDLPSYKLVNIFSYTKKNVARGLPMRVYVLARLDKHLTKFKLEKIT